MWLYGILARAERLGNAKPVAVPLHAFLVLWRRGGPVRTLMLLGVCALLFAGFPMPLSGMLMPITMLFIGEAEFSRLRARNAVTASTVAWRMLNTIIASAALLLLTNESWPAAATS